MVAEPARARALGLIPESVLAHVPGFTAGGSAWATRLPGGTVNASFRVETSAGRFIVRIHDSGSKALGADHEREARLHAAAAAVGLAPALIHVDADYRFMVMEHVAGDTWTAGDFARPDRLGQLGAALHVLHSITPPPVAPFDIGASTERLYEQLLAALPTDASHLTRLMDRGRAALRATGSTLRPATVIHNDLHHTNLIGTERLFLLDWEYAAVTDPLLDLACLLAYYPQAASHTDALLDASRLAGHASPEMLGAATWLFVLLSYFWYRVRRLAGPVPASEVVAEQELLARLA
jgi:aminoglycoside phosphotransferase (APT) family kinase protein